MFLFNPCNTNNPNDNTTPQEEDYRWERDNFIKELKITIRELEEDNSWLRLELEKKDLQIHQLKGYSLIET